MYFSIPPYLKKFQQHATYANIWAGRNDKGQLGHGDTKRLDAPKLIEGLADVVVVAAACGRNHTLALTGTLGQLACAGYGPGPSLFLTTQPQSTM